MPPQTRQRTEASKPQASEKLSSRHEHSKKAQQSISASRASPHRAIKGRVSKSKSGSKSSSNGKTAAGRVTNVRNQETGTVVEDRPSKPVNSKFETSNTSRAPKHYWLMKAEPESRFENGVDVKFSIDDLRACTEPEAWDGVRNYVARNNMRAMKRDDLAFFYHSNCKHPGVVGIMEIVKEATTDQTSFDANHPYYDPKDSPDKAKWSVVHVQFQEKFDRVVGLHELKSYGQNNGPLSGMQVLTQSRLSVSSVTEDQWKFVLNLARQEKATDTNES